MLLSSDLGERSPQSPPSLDPPLGRPRVRLGRVLPYQDAAGSCKDLVNWYCSLPTRRTMYARAAGSTHRTQKNEWTETRNCTNSVSALQDHCSHKAPTTNHHIKKNEWWESDAWESTCMYESQRRHFSFVETRLAFLSVFSVWAYARWRHLKIMNCATSCLSVYKDYTY